MHAILQRLITTAGCLLLCLGFVARAQTTITVEYIHTDALGSPVAVTNEAGQVIERTQWEPYGAAIGKPAYDGPGYTGHVMDGATGLTYMQQRYYDPMIGRFLSVDPVTANSGTGANFNRYWYANNNPYKFTDPDGRESACFVNGVGCGLRPYTDEDREKMKVAMAGLTGMTLLAVPDPTDIAIGAALGRFMSSFTAARGFSQAHKYIDSITDGARSTGGRSGRRTTEYDGSGGAEGAKKLFDRLTGGRSESRDGGRLGSLGDGSRVHVSTRTMKDGTRETSVRISRQREGSRIVDNVKVRFREKSE